MFDKIINLSSIEQRAKDGYYENELEIKKEFNDLLQRVRDSKRATIKSFHDSNDCTHETTTPPYYQLQRRLIDYVYVFQKSCTKCGKKFHKTCDSDSEYNENNHPPGYENSESRYYNNNI